MKQKIKFNIHFSDLGDSPKGIVLMCSFWISSIVPMVRVPSLANAKLQQKYKFLSFTNKYPL